MSSITDALDALLDPGNCPVDGDGNLIPPPADDEVVRLCQSLNPGIESPVNQPDPAFDLTANANDSAVIDNFVSETLQVGAAPINVYKLLGVHEQGRLQDLTGNGTALSGGDHPNFPKENAFDNFITQWRSSQTGTAVIGQSFIGYDFGEIILDNGRLRYGTETFLKNDVASIRIRQGCRKENRATKARVERSSDGVKWYGVEVIDLPDCEGTVTVGFRRSVPSRFWRLRPVTFNGGPEDAWEIQVLQLMDYEATRVSNIQDRIFLENRDRDYDENPIRMKGSYQPQDIQAFMSKHGFGGPNSPDTWIIEVSFTNTIGLLGRPFVIGDILQLPSETQYTVDLDPVLRYVEVRDVAWSTNSYTPGWIPTMQRLIARPVMASVETQDILGKLTEDRDDLGTVDINDGNRNKAYKDIFAESQTIEADANTRVPVRGEDYADIGKVPEAFYEFAEQEGSIEVARRIDRTREHFGIDAMPPNGEPYTEGDTFPSNPRDGDYHRLTYTNIRTGIPARLHRYSEAKETWIYLEKDRRAEFRNTKPQFQELLDPDTSTVTKPHDKDAFLDDET
jgi:hypothetical protein